jgi:hypothetical protein
VFAFHLKRELLKGYNLVPKTVNAALVWFANTLQVHRAAFRSAHTRRWTVIIQYVTDDERTFWLDVIVITVKKIDILAAIQTR